MDHSSFVLILLVLQTPQAQFKKTRSDDTDPLQAVVEKLSSDLVSLQAELTAQKAATAAQKSDLESKLATQANRIAELEAFNNRTVAFSAYISDEPSIAASGGSVIPFRGIITNIGGAYNPSSSVFTAPRDGHYFFIVHADCSTDYRSQYVTLNNHRVFGADNDHGDGHVTGSGLLTLKIGDVVAAIHYSSAGSVDAGNESTFSGFLVK